MALLSVFCLIQLVTSEVSSSSGIVIPGYQDSSSLHSALSMLVVCRHHFSLYMCSAPSELKQNKFTSYSSTSPLPAHRQVSNHSKQAQVHQLLAETRKGAYILGGDLHSWCGQAGMLNAIHQIHSWILPFFSDRLSTLSSPVPAGQLRRCTNTPDYRCIALVQGLKGTQMCQYEALDRFVEMFALPAEAKKVSIQDLHFSSATRTISLFQDSVLFQTELLLFSSYQFFYRCTSLHRPVVTCQLLHSPL